MNNDLLIKVAREHLEKEANILRAAKVKGRRKLRQIIHSITSPQNITGPPMTRAQADRIMAQAQANPSASPYLRIQR
jgi:hypothetical protein